MKRTYLRLLRFHPEREGGRCIGSESFRGLEGFLVDNGRQEHRSFGGTPSYLPRDLPRHLPIYVTALLTAYSVRVVLAQYLEHLFLNNGWMDLLLLAEFADLEDIYGL